MIVIYRRKGKRFIFVLAGIFFCVGTPGVKGEGDILQARTINVPRDYLTIKSAVAAARDGDAVEVEDGFYFEKNIIVDRAIRLRAKTLFGAVVYGRYEVNESLFIVRAAAEISGFVLKNSGTGILQRGSPPVAWKGRDLAFLNMIGSAISLNDQAGHIGDAILENVIVDNCSDGVSTNDAGNILIRSAFVSNCGEAFSGYDHLSFDVDKAVVWRCRTVRSENNGLPSPPGTNRIRLGKDVLVSGFDVTVPETGSADPAAFVMRLFAPDPSLTARESDRRMALVEYVIGGLFLRGENRAAAERRFRSALRRAGESGFKDLSVAASIALTRLAEEGGRAAEVEAFGRAAALEIDSIQAAIPLKIFQTGFFRDKVDVFELLIGILKPAEAFFFSEKYRTSGILTSLTSPDTGSGLWRAVRMNPDFIRLSRTISRLQSEMNDPMTRLNRRVAVNESLENAEDEREALLMRIKQSYAKSAGKPVSEPCRYEEVRDALLAPDTALIEYFLGPSRAYAFLLTRESLEMAVLPSPDVLRTAVSNYLEFLRLSNSRKFLGWTGARALSRMLLGPFETTLGRPSLKKIIIVPDDVLFSLPFEALASPLSPAPRLKSPAPSRFWVEDFEISYAPSATFLSRRPRLRAGKEPHRKDFLAVADPATRHPFLPGSRDEVRRIARFFDEDRTDFLIGKEATEDNLKARDLMAYRILHFAVHGYQDQRWWWRSGLVLGNKAGSEEDGLIQPLDFLFLHPNAELAILSACQSGAGWFEPGEGLLGLSYSFFIGGTRSVVASLWDAPDLATSRFMERFYRNLSSDLRPADALRRAKIDMLGSPEAHPLNWAAFVLLGEK